MSALDRLKALVAMAQKTGKAPSMGPDKTDKSPIGAPCVGFVAPKGGAPSGNCPTARATEAGRWRHLFEERAAIREHDGGMSRADAEAAALADLATQWRAEHRIPVGPQSACAHCAAPVAMAEAMPVLAAGGHVWLHDRCWAPMDAARRAQAIAAVRALLEAEP